MSSVSRSFKEPPSSNAAYIVRLDVTNLPIGATPASVSEGIASAKAAGQTVNVVGNLIEVAPAIFLADIFNGDVTLNGGDLLRDLGNEIILTWNGDIYTRARLVQRVLGRNNSNASFSAPFYVTTWESYGGGGVPNNGGGYTSDVFVSRVS